jgi:hypothetical protein
MKTKKKLTVLDPGTLREFRFNRRFFISSVLAVQFAITISLLILTTTIRLQNAI